MEKTKNSPCSTRDGPADSGWGYVILSRVNLGLKQYQFCTEDIKGIKYAKHRMVQIHPEGRIIDRKYQWRGMQDIFSILHDTPLLEENREFLRRFIMDAKLGKTIRKRAKKKVGPARLLKYLQDLKKLDVYFQKPLDKVTQQDMEQFIIDLEEGRVAKKNGQAYAPETQVCLKKIVIKFYRWLLGDCKTTPELVSWIDTSFEIKDYRALTKEQVDTILTIMTSNTQANLARARALIMFLFDSGVRADECLNVRIGHLCVENGEYKVRVGYSKTFKRTLRLPLCKDYLDRWLDLHPARDSPQAQLFPYHYHSLQKAVVRAGKVIKEKLTPHGLRHSAATYWAQHLSRYQLCYRMGWAMSSKQPDRYIDQEGLDQDVVCEVVERDKLQKVSNENVHLKAELATIRDQLDRLMKKDKEELAKIIAIVKQEK